MKLTKAQRQKATKYISKNYKDKDHTNKLTREIDPKISHADLDLDSDPSKFPEDLNKIEATVMDTNAAMADYAFNKIMPIVKDKYPKPQQMPVYIINAVDNMLLWKMTAMLRDTYKNHLPEQFVNLCIDIIPLDRRFLKAIGIKADAKVPTKSNSYEEKMSSIKSFLKLFDMNKATVMKTLRTNIIGKNGQN